ncbi:hypothetical protein ARMSODRAFT_1018283 [Armillaria solidipes]|uniref:Uncharacterized protein n=1 Tax=Armillaria solidipes TaxID=1076256 RepID=A0A2H3BT86_9AGAR|nr:hypothetical protein ARMSODRAFT_1018283 [Armillaria solidipes]
MFSTYLALTALPLTLVHGLTISNPTETVTSTGPITILWQMSSGDPSRYLCSDGAVVRVLVALHLCHLVPHPCLDLDLAPPPPPMRASASGSSTCALSTAPSTSSAASTASTSAFNAASRMQVGGTGVLTAVLAWVITI